MIPSDSLLSPPVKDFSRQALWFLIQAGAFLIPFDIVVRVSGVRMTLCEAILSLAFVLWIFGLVKDGQKIFGKEFLLPAGLLVLASALSVIAAQNKFLAIRETVQFAWIGCMFIMLLNVIRDTVQAVRLGMLAVGSGAIASLVGMYQYFFLREPPDMLIAITRLRAMGFYDQPNALGAYLSGVVPFLWGFIFVETVPRWVSGKRLRPLILLGISVLYALTLTATFSRGSWVGAGVGVFILLALLRDKTKRKRLAAVVALSLASALVILVDHSFQPEWKGRSFSNKQRLMLLDAGFQMFKDHLLIGVGSGNYSVRLLEYASPELRETMQTDYDREKKSFYVNPQKKPDIELVHNIVLQVGTEMGVIGLAGFSFFLVLYLKKIWAAFKLHLGDDALLRIASFAGFVAILTGGMFGWPFTHGVQELLILNMAIAVGPSTLNA